MVQNESFRILILAQHYAPEEVSGAVLASQLAEDLAIKGMEVTLLTASPSYPYGKVFRGYRNNPYKIEWHNNVRVIRIWSYISPSKSFISRTINQITFSISCFFVGLVSGRYNIIFSYSPPLFLGVSASLISSLKKTPWILRVEDLFPDTAITGGILQNKVAIRFLFWIEKYIYKKATHISLISRTFKDILISKNIDPNKLSVTPVWADPDEIRPGEKENAFRQKYNLDGKFVILYTGNIGHTSALEDIIPVAESLRKYTSITFMIVGEGIKKKQLELLAIQKDLINLKFLPYQKRELVQDMLAAADLCLVTINQSASDFSLPSKSFTYMSSGRPILAISPKNGEIAKLLQDTKSGINVENGHFEEIINTILHFYKNPEFGIELGSNGRRALELNFSRTFCVEEFRKFILKYAI